jgi:hypothetical protein
MKMITAPNKQPNKASMRCEWLNYHLGGIHWVHNDLTDVNLLAFHASCLTCRAFRSKHWPRRFSP